MANQTIPSEHQLWLAQIADSLDRYFIYNTLYLEQPDIRNAALIAINALRWLAEPAETEIVKIKKRPFTVKAYPPE